jgi:hypothetical protein
MDTDPTTKEALLKQILPGLIKPGENLTDRLLSQLKPLSDETIAPDWPDWLREPNQPRKTKTKLLADHSNIGDVAMLYITGYRDFLATQSFRLATKLAGKKNYRFIAGLWIYRGPYSGTTGARKLAEILSPGGPLGWGPLVAAWFNIHLRGRTGAAYPSTVVFLRQEPVVYYIKGENI